MDLTHLGPMWSLVSRRAQCSGHYFSYFILMTSLATFNPTFVCLQTIVSCIVLLDLTMTPSCKMIYTVSSLLRWAATWQMRLNSKKSHILSISRQRNQSSPVYYLGTDVLSTVSSDTYQLCHLIWNGMNTFLIYALRQLGLLTLWGVIHIVVLRKLKIWSSLKPARPAGAHKNCPILPHCSWVWSIFSLQYRYNGQVW